MNSPIIAMLLLLIQLALAAAYPYVIVPVEVDSDALLSSGDSTDRTKRSFDRLEAHDFGLYKRSVPLKRAFDRLDFSDFSMRRKRAFDRLDFSDFSMRRKRAFDRLDFSDFSMRRKKSVGDMVPAGIENVDDLDGASRTALIQELANSIRTLRNVREQEENQ